MRPRRSARQPKTGLSAYMPAVWKLITMPTIRSSAPPWAMWTGAIDITPTITSCATLIVASASRAFGVQ